MTPEQEQIFKKSMGTYIANQYNYSEYFQQIIQKNINVSEDNIKAMYNGSLNLPNNVIKNGLFYNFTVERKEGLIEINAENSMENANYSLQLNETADDRNDPTDWQEMYIEA